MGKTFTAIKMAVDSYDRVTTKILSPAEGGGKVFYYVKYFAEYGQEVRVKIWQKAGEAIIKLSDAWPIK